MFMLSIRLSRKRILLGAVALVAVVGLGVAGIRLFTGDTMASAASAGETAMRQSTGSKPKKVVAKTNEERLAFIQGFGWEIAPDPVEVLEVIIPEEFDQVYLEYNALQKTQGYDLTSYAGKRCKRYSYQITNHPGTKDEVRFNLLLYGDKVVGGDVCSTAQEGFMHGFAAE